MNKKCVYARAVSREEQFCGNESSLISKENVLFSLLFGSVFRRILYYAQSILLEAHESLNILISVCYEVFALLLPVTAAEAMLFWNSRTRRRYNPKGWDSSWACRILMDWVVSAQERFMWLESHWAVRLFLQCLFYGWFCREIHAGAITWGTCFGGSSSAPAEQYFRRVTVNQETWAF